MPPKYDELYDALSKANARMVSLEKEVEMLKKDRGVSERQMNKYAQTLTGIGLALDAHYKGFQDYKWGLSA